MKQPVDIRLPRVAFDFIVKSDIKIVVWFVAATSVPYLAGRGWREKRREKREKRKVRL